MDFIGKTAVISGGLGGIGYALANYLLQNGISALAILDIASDSNKIETLKKEFTSCKIIFQSVDVADILSVERSFHEILGELKKFDILVNAAGILDETNAELCVKVNLLGVINICQTAIKFMGKQNGNDAGTVINIASMLGVKVKLGMPIYCATKHGVVAYTKTMATTYDIEKYGIRFINACPSKTDTQMIQCFYAHRENGNYHTSNDQRKTIQSAEDCAKCIIEILRSAETGTTWSIKRGVLHQIVYPKAFDRVSADK